MQLRALSEVYRGFADPVRLRMLSLLSAHGRLPVGEICTALKLPQSTVSRQLAILRRASLVVAHRQGRFVYYCLSTHGPLQHLALSDTLSAAQQACPALRREAQRMKQESQTKP